MTTTTTAAQAVTPAVETFECAGCECLFSAVPVQDDTEVWWIGAAKARRWHSVDCMNDHGERVAEIASRA